MGQREFWRNARAELRGDPSEVVADKSGTRVKPPRQLAHLGGGPNVPASVVMWSTSDDFCSCGPLFGTADHARVS